LYLVHGKELGWGWLGFRALEWDESHFAVSVDLSWQRLPYHRTDRS
jgi:hypothetical protein